MTTLRLAVRVVMATATLGLSACSTVGGVSAQRTETDSPIGLGSGRSSRRRIALRIMACPVFRANVSTAAAPRVFAIRVRG